MSCTLLCRASSVISSTKNITLPSLLFVVETLNIRWHQSRLYGNYNSTTYNLGLVWLSNILLNLMICNQALVMLWCNEWQNRYASVVLGKGEPRENLTTQELHGWFHSLFPSSAIIHFSKISSLILILLVLDSSSSTSHYYYSKQTWQSLLSATKYSSVWLFLTFCFIA